MGRARRGGGSLTIELEETELLPSRSFSSMLHVHWPMDSQMSEVHPYTYP